VFPILIHYFSVLEWGKYLEIRLWSLSLTQSRTEILFVGKWKYLHCGHYLFNLVIKKTFHPFVSSKSEIVKLIQLSSNSWHSYLRCFASLDFILAPDVNVFECLFLHHLIGTIDHTVFAAWTSSQSTNWPSMIESFLSFFVFFIVHLIFWRLTPVLLLMESSVCLTCST